MPETPNQISINYVEDNEPPQNELYIGAPAMEILSSIAQELLVGGLARIGSLASSKAMRISKIDTLIKTKVIENEAIKTAVNDFKTALVSRLSIAFK